VTSSKTFVTNGITLTCQEGFVLFETSCGEHRVFLRGRDFFLTLNFLFKNSRLVC
jgi:hypothetical protein